MSIPRRIPYSAHGALEFPLGIALMVGPFLLGAEVAGVVVAVALGAVISGVALTSVGDARRAPISLSAHEAYDQALGIAGVAGAIALAVVGQEAVGLVVLVASVVLLAISVGTRYSSR